MQPITSQDTGLATLLGCLREVRHAHLLPLESIRSGVAGLHLEYG